MDILAKLTTLSLVLFLAVPDHMRWQPAQGWRFYWVSHSFDGERLEQDVGGWEKTKGDLNPTPLNLDGEGDIMWWKKVTELSSGPIRNIVKIELCASQGYTPDSMITHEASKQ